MSASSLGRRSRPVADAPPLDGAAIAKAWLVELVARAPLDRAASLPGPRFAEEAPRLCAAMADALADDARLAALERGGPLAPLAAGAGDLAGASAASDAVAALDALRAVTWEAAVDALHRPEPGQVAQLADRLAAVVATVTGAVLDPARAPAPAPDGLEPPAPVPEPRIRRLRPVEDATAFDADRVAPWTAAIERRADRHRADGAPFGVLCLELAGVERLLAADDGREVAAALDALEGAIVDALGPSDALVRERPGRYWLTAPDTTGPDARALAHRIAGAVADLPPHRGAALQVAIGVATCPADGDEARTLEDLAEQGLFAARAAGLRVAGPPG